METWQFWTLIGVMFFIGIGLGNDIDKLRSAVELLSRKW